MFSIIFLKYIPVFYNAVFKLCLCFRFKAAEFDIYEYYALGISTNGHGFSKHLFMKIQEILKRVNVRETLEVCFCLFLFEPNDWSMLFSKHLHYSKGLVTFMFVKRYSYFI